MAEQPPKKPPRTKQPWAWERLSDWWMKNFDPYAMSPYLRYQYPGARGTRDIWQDWRQRYYNPEAASDYLKMGAYGPRWTPQYNAEPAATGALWRPRHAYWPAEGQPGYNYPYGGGGASNVMRSLPGAGGQAANTMRQMESGTVINPVLSDYYQTLISSYGKDNPPPPPGYIEPTAWNPRGNWRGVAEETALYGWQPTNYGRNVWGLGSQNISNTGEVEGRYNRWGTPLGSAAPVGWGATGPGFSRGGRRMSNKYWTDARIQRLNLSQGKMGAALKAGGPHGDKNIFRKGQPQSQPQQPQQPERPLNQTGFWQNALINWRY